MKNFIFSFSRLFHILGVLFLLGLFACPMDITPKYPAPPDRPYEGERWFAALKSWEGHSKEELIDYWGGTWSYKPCPPPEKRGFFGLNICQPPEAPPIVAGKAAWFLSWVSFVKERWSNHVFELEHQPDISVGEPDPSYERKTYACRIDFWADENGIIIYGRASHPEKCDWLEENTAWLSSQYLPFAPESPAEKKDKKVKKKSE